MFCRYCGSKIEEGTLYCTNCGAAVTEDNYNKAQPYVPTQCKSKLAAGLLAIFLGGIGIHNFYLGYTKKAIIQLILGTIGAVFIIGPIISSIWSLVEGILYLTTDQKDASGHPLI